MRIESTDFAFFVTATLIQRQTGGDLSEVLNNISGMIRQRIRLAQSVKAKTAEGRFTGYILSAFPAVMFVIASMLNPDYTSVLWKTTTGMVMLCDRVRPDAYWVVCDQEDYDGASVKESGQWLSGQWSVKVLATGH